MRNVSVSVMLRRRETSTRWKKNENKRASARARLCATIRVADAHKRKVLMTIGTDNLSNGWGQTHRCRRCCCAVWCRRRRRHHKTGAQANLFYCRAFAQDSCLCRQADRRRTRERPLSRGWQMLKCASQNARARCKARDPGSRN